MKDIKEYRHKRSGDICTLDRVLVVKNHSWYYLNTEEGFCIVISTPQLRNDYEEMKDD